MLQKNKTVNTEFKFQLPLFKNVYLIMKRNRNESNGFEEWVCIKAEYLSV